MSKNNDNGESSVSAAARNTPAGAPANNGGNDDPASQQSDQRAQFDNDDTPEFPEDPDDQIQFDTDGGLRDKMLWQEFRMDFGKWKMEAARLRSFEQDSEE